VGNLAYVAVPGLNTMGFFNTIQVAYTKVVRFFQFIRRWFRTALGWVVIAVGLVLLPLPIPLGLILLIIGAWLIGTRSRAVRLTTVYTRLFLRRWARLPIPYVNRPGRFLLAKQRQLAREVRRRRHFHDARPVKRPMPPAAAMPPNPEAPPTPEALASAATESLPSTAGTPGRWRRLAGVQTKLLVRRWARTPYAGSLGGRALWRQQQAASRQQRQQRQQRSLPHSGESTQ
jgi:hypothetical protein